MRAQASLVALLYRHDKHQTAPRHPFRARGRSQEDPHPEDTERFLAKWQTLFETGDPYFNPNLSPHSPNWQVADPLEFKLDIRRRIYKRTRAGIVTSEFATAGTVGRRKRLLRQGSVDIRSE